MAPGLDFTVITYGTKDGIYDKYLNRLKESCHAHNINFHGETISPRSRAGATLIKPSFIKDKLDSFKKPVIWLDADAVISGSFQLPGDPWDVGVTPNTAYVDRKRNPVSAFLLAFRPTPSAFYFLDIWKRLCEANWIVHRNLDHGRLSWARMIADYQYHEVDLTSYVKGKVTRDAGKPQGSTIKGRWSYHLTGMLQYAMIYPVIRKPVARRLSKLHPDLYQKLQRFKNRNNPF